MSGQMQGYRLNSQFGTLMIVTDGLAVTASGFTEDEEWLRSFAGIGGAEAIRMASAEESKRAEHPAVRAALAYFDGETAALDAVQCRGIGGSGGSQGDGGSGSERSERKGRVSAGGGFTVAAREAMRRIPAGSTATYTELAAAAGNPRAVRGAARACATNPIAFFVPCHRVVRTDGGLAGFLYGVDVKRALLQFEGAEVVGRGR